MISVEEALAHVLSDIEPLSAEQVSLTEALGRVLARDVTSRVSHPPAAVSAMDGYAVISGDLAKVPATLERIGESAAGQGFDGAVGPGQCVRIFNGEENKVSTGEHRAEIRVQETGGDNGRLDPRVRLEKVEVLPRRLQELRLQSVMRNDA